VVQKIVGRHFVLGPGGGGVGVGFDVGTSAVYWSE